MNAPLLGIMNKIEFAVGVLTEGDNAIGAAGNFLIGKQSIAIESAGPEPAGNPIAADISTGQFREPATPINIASGN
jgi:hypothetical protein